jgi:nucleotide-binding universal stress UspA family protein
VPLDGSALAEGVLPIAARLATGGRSTVVLVRALAASEDEEAARAYVEGEADRLGVQGLAVEAEVIPGPPARALAEFAADHDIDLIVMATHGLGGRFRRPFGGVAEALLHRADLPLVLLKAMTVGVAL